jgi:hypothetical protein
MVMYFWEALLAGATTGRAVLEARLRYSRFANAGNAYALKTLAQFILLGDPSIQPVEGPTAIADELAAAAQIDTTQRVMYLADRGFRRDRMAAFGQRLFQGRPIVQEAEGVTPPPVLEELARNLPESRGYQAFDVFRSSDLLPDGTVMAAFAPPHRRYHAITSGHEREGGVIDIRVTLALEIDSEIVDVHELSSR